MKTLIKLFCTKFYKCYLIKLQKYKKKKYIFCFQFVLKGLNLWYKSVL